MSRFSPRGRARLSLQDWKTKSRDKSRSFRDKWRSATLINRLSNTNKQRGPHKGENYPATSASSMLQVQVESVDEINNENENIAAIPVAVDEDKLSNYSNYVDNGNKYSPAILKATFLQIDPTSLPGHIRPRETKLLKECSRSAAMKRRYQDEDLQAVGGKNIIFEKRKQFFESLTKQPRTDDSNNEENDK